MNKYVNEAELIKHRQELKPTFRTLNCHTTKNGRLGI